MSLGAGWGCFESKGRRRKGQVEAVKFLCVSRGRPLFTMGALSGSHRWAVVPSRPQGQALSARLCLWPEATHQIPALPNYL